MTDRHAIVLDASAMVDLLVGHRGGGAIGRWLAESAVHVPAHFDAEVLSALGRLCRAKALTTERAANGVISTARAPFMRHTLEGLVSAAWLWRDNMRPVDALYVELAERLGVPLLTTDRRLVNAYPRAHTP